MIRIGGFVDGVQVGIPSATSTLYDDQKRLRKLGYVSITFPFPNSSRKDLRKVWKCLSPLLCRCCVAITMRDHFSIVGGVDCPSPRLAHLRCVIGRRETMNKLSQRVARALPLQKSCNHTSSPYTTSASHVTSYRFCPPAQTHKRASVHSPVAARNALHLRTIAHTPTRTISSDADYTAFLDQANQDVAPA